MIVTGRKVSVAFIQSQAFWIDPPLAWQTETRCVAENLGACAMQSLWDLIPKTF